jgi:hypothetical protein
MRSARLARVLTGLALAAAVSVPALAQEKKPAAAPPMSKEQQAQMDAMTKAMTPGTPHKRLAELAGEWTFKNKMWMDPSAPPTESTGTATYRMIMGGRYLQTEQHGEFMGMPFEGAGILAYDNVTRKYYSSWIDSMSTGLMLSTGTYDPARRAYTWLADMVDPTRPNVTLKIREVITIVDANTHRLEWYQAEGGKEVKTMEIVYTRKK